MILHASTRVCGIAAVAAPPLTDADRVPFKAEPERPAPSPALTPCGFGLMRDRRQS